MRNIIFVPLVVLIMVLGGTFFGSTEGEISNLIYGEGGVTMTQGPVSIPSGGGYDTRYYVKVARDVPVSSMSMSISTMNSGLGMAIEAPTLDLGTDGNVEWTFEGTGYGKFGEQSYLSDGKTKKTLDFPANGGTKTDNNIMVPQGSQIVDASIEMKGRFVPKTLSQYTIQSDSAGISFNGLVMDYGDIDLDGYTDIVVSDIRNSRIIWFKNPNNPDAVDWSSYVICSGSVASSCYSLDVADVDSDGDMDIGITSYNYGYITYVRNNGLGASWTTYTFYSSFYYASQIRIADVNRDGNPDFIVAPYYYYYYYSNYVSVFRAPANPNTTAGWSRTTVGSAPYSYCYSYLSMDIGDFNKDGYPDIAFGIWYYYNANHVYAYLAPNTTSTTWTSKTADSYSYQPQFIEVSDLNADGFDDIMVTTSQNDLYLLYTTNYATSWTERTVDTSANYPKIIVAADLDGDGDTDMLTGGGSGQYEVRTYIRGSDIASWTRSVIATDIQTPNAISIYDVDKDSDLDLMVSGTYGSQLVFFKCTAKSPLAYTKVWIEDGGIKAIYACDFYDIDGDGDKDMAFVGRDTGYVGWWENDGTPFDAPGKLHRVGGMGSPKDVWWGDVDGDGDKDVVAISSGGMAYWFENGGDPLGTWTSHLAFSGVGSLYGSWVGDLTKDGKADIAYTTNVYSGGVVGIYYSPANPASQTFTQHIVASGVSYAAGITGDDMDNDGDNDLVVVMGQWGSGNAILYKNPPVSTSGQWPSTTVASGLYYPEDVFTCDISSDGYKDVITTERYYSWYSCSVRWFQNPRTGGSWKGYLISKLDYNWYVTAGDIGGDGYADVVFSRGSYSSPSQVIWMEEPDSYDSDWISHNLGSYSGTMDLDLADLDNDGLLDIVTTSTSGDRTSAWRMNVAYPQNIGIDVGNDRTGYDLTVPGTWMGSKVVDLKPYFQDVIDNGPVQVIKVTDNYGITLYSIPLEIYSETTGKMSIEAIHITYEVKVMVLHDGAGKSMGDVLERLIPKYPGDDIYTRIYITVGGKSGGQASIQDISIEFNAKPQQKQDLQDLTLPEEGTKTFPVDLTEIFEDDYTAPEDLKFDIVLVGPMRSKVLARVVDNHIIVDASISKDFFTRSSRDIEAKVIVTDTGGPNGVPPRTFETNVFSIFVTNVNDRPGRTSVPMPNIFAEEGKTVTSAYLEGRELFIDVDGDPLRYEPVPDLSSTDYDESAGFRIKYIPANQTLEVSLSPFSDWTGTVPIKMYCYDSAEPDYEHDPFVKFSVFVNNTNDGPFWLDVPTLTIQEGSVRNDLVKLTDLVFDIDTSASSLKFFIEGYTNTTFVYLKIFEVNGAPYIGIEPRWIDWNGETNVRVSVSDGEFSETTVIRIVVTPVNDLPTVQINEPLPDAMVQNGPLSIVGQAFDVEGIKRVEVFYDGKWNLAKGTNYWGYTVDVPKLGIALENVEIQVRAYDGETYANASITIGIDRYLPPVDLDWDDDGYNNDEDDFPNNPSEWSDRDGDKVGDNTDLFPDNPNLQFDMDKDTYGDQIDTHPYDPLLWNDQDEDGFNDEDIITYRNNNGNEPTDEGSSMLVPILLWTLASIMLVVAVLSGLAYFRKKSAARDPVKSARYVARVRKRRLMVHDLTEKLPLVHASKKFESLITGSDSSVPAISPHIHGMPMKTGMKPAPVRPALPSGPMNMARPPFKP